MSTLSRLIGLFNSLATPGRGAITKSPVPHLLTNNLPPTEQEKQKIEESLLVAREQAAGLQKQLQGRRTSNGSGHSRIVRDLHLTETFIHEHQSLLSPLRVLPDELLVLIFLSCLPDLDSQPWAPHSWGTIPSFRLSQVCQEWRMIALDTPNLWSILGDVQVNPKTANMEPHSYFAFIEELFRRSRDADLWIYVTITMSYAQGEHPMIDLMLKHETRWGAFGIFASEDTIQAMCEPRLSLPRLHKLNINLWTRSMTNQTVGFAHAPALTELSISGQYPHELSLPYRQLRVYREGSAEQHICGSQFKLYEVLTNAKDLEKLELWELRYPLHNPPPTIPATRSLSIGTGSETPLRTLFIRNTTLSPDELSSLLELTPYLEELSTDFQFLVDHIPLQSTAYNSTIEKFALRLRPLRILVLHGSKKHILAHKDSILAFAQSMVDSDSHATVLSHRALENSTAAQQVQVALNFWQEEGPTQSPERLTGDLGEMSENTTDGANLFAWRLRLHQALPQLEQYPTGTYDMRFTGGLNHLFRELERIELEPGRDVANLHLSKLHFSLRQITKLAENQIHGDIKYNFRARAAEVLKKWELLICADLQSNPVNWALKGSTSIVYISQNDEIRYSSQALDMIYGLDDSGCEDQLWPEKK
ncbi:hypothetical protein GALMADRAFT_161359 [Galerina marginata CBS 339.88]|uniref:Uncharacterized protein n=1 Tax=Galerina marginata (strain CBS 339.88) TaxID=685588 RepID=A0A067SJ91_GALM3|nr:hypothetical protein GALMADRAFT_161359 [Galerina marginata CBS 339.88]